MRNRITPGPRGMIALIFGVLVGGLVLGSGSEILGNNEIAPKERGIAPKGGFVPTEKVALKIAEAVIEPVYGIKCRKEEHPLRARLVGGEWYVKGSAPTNIDWMGGVVEVHINKTNGCITLMKHGK